MKVRDVIRLLEGEGWLQRAALTGNTSTRFGPGA
jgi:hypothetical protein